MSFTPARVSCAKAVKWNAEKDPLPCTEQGRSICDQRSAETQAGYFGMVVRWNGITQP